MEPNDGCELRHRGTRGPLGGPWPFHPKPQAGESLTSWVTRVSEAYGLSLQAFCREVWPKRDLLFGDFDRNPSLPVLEALETGTRVSRAQLLGMTLVDLQARTTGGHPSVKGWLPWVVPALARRREPYGLQYCPECLAEDDPPHFKLIWRLAFVTTCPVHRRLLLDRCPGCDAALNARVPRSESTGLASPIFICRKCGYDIRGPTGGSRGWRPMKGVLDLQARLLAGVQEGWVVTPWGEVIHAVPFFKGLQRVIRLLVSKGKIGRFRKEAARRAGQPDPGEELISGARGTLFEPQSVHSRHRLLALVEWVMGDWPERFVEVCEAVGLKSARLTQDAKDWTPYWFWRAAHERLRVQFARWRRELLPPDVVISYQALGNRALSPNLRKIRARIRFIQEHPELGEDPSMIAYSMKINGLYSKNSEVAVLQKHCGWLIRITRELEAGERLPGGLVVARGGGRIRLLLANT